MADIDKEGLMNMLGSILGEDKKSTVDSLVNSFDSQNSSSSGDGAVNASELIDTAEMMTKISRVMEKLNHTKNNREFALLSAIRPYVRDTRKGTVDTCLRMLQMVNVVNEIKKEG